MDNHRYGGIAITSKTASMPPMRLIVWRARLPGGGADGTALLIQHWPCWRTCDLSQYEAEPSMHSTETIHVDLFWCYAIANCYAMRL